MRVCMVNGVSVCEKTERRQREREDTKEELPDAMYFSIHWVRLIKHFVHAYICIYIYIYIYNTSTRVTSSPAN